MDAIDFRDYGYNPIMEPTMFKLNMIPKKDKLVIETILEKVEIAIFESLLYSGKLFMDHWNQVLSSEG